MTKYHAGLEQNVRQQNQDEFMDDNKPLMVATNAFGMGVNKSNVRFVVHFNMPKNLESYYQEAGRAGRDGLKAECLLLYSGRDVKTNQFLIEKSYEQSVEKEISAREKLEKELLEQMTYFCLTKDCLRNQMLRYFGEEAKGDCKNCSNCLAKSKAAPHGKAAESDLLKALKKVRTDLAEKHKVPAYIIFADAALKNMCEILPRTATDFLTVSGVGPVKMERYGADFLAVINNYLRD